MGPPWLYVQKSTGLAVGFSFGIGSRIVSATAPQANVVAGGVAHTILPSN